VAGFPGDTHLVLIPLLPMLLNAPHNKIIAKFYANENDKLDKLKFGLIGMPGTMVNKILEISFLYS